MGRPLPAVLLQNIWRAPQPAARGKGRGPGQHGGTHSLGLDAASGVPPSMAVLVRRGQEQVSMRVEGVRKAWQSAGRNVGKTRTKRIFPQMMPLRRPMGEVPFSPSLWNGLWPIFMKILVWVKEGVMVAWGE